MSDRLALTYPLTIYYDGACPVCSTEMTMLEARATDHALRLVDCSTGRLDADCRAAGIAADDLSTRIHARDATGRWLTGVDVFVAAYGAAGFATLVRLLADRRLRPVWERLYPWIVRHRRLLARLGVQRSFEWVARRR